MTEVTGVAEASDERRDELERERDFLLRSLDDLERERDKGTVDDESYERLHADYTARAAAVLRTLRDGVDSRPAPAPVSRRRQLLTIAGILAFAVVAAVVLAAALGARLPGETSSGNTGSTPRNPITVEERIARLEQAVAANPNDVPSRLLLAQLREADGDLTGALQLYDAVLAIEPDNAEAEAQAGRILYITAQAAARTAPEAAAGLVDRSKARLDHAVELDPRHANARYFRAIVLANEFGAFAEAQNDLQRYLVLVPDGAFADDARQLLADVTGALERTTPKATSPSSSNR
jgi:cytochrome c-type biogenesis protein CcmH/NrfG